MLQFTGRDRLVSVVTLFSIWASFGINAWSNRSPLNGLSIGEISNQLFADVMITPANYAFIIWGVIYVGLFGFGIYQCLPAAQTVPHLQRLRYGVIGSSVAQGIWVFLFLGRQFVLSMVAMVAILLSLMVIYLALPDRPRSRLDRWWIHVPFSIYFAWISVATLVNGAIALTSINWQGWGISPTVWTLLLLVIATGLGILIAIHFADVAFVSVYGWAFVAIAVRQSHQPVLALTALGLALLLAIVVGWCRFWKSSPPRSTP